MAKQRRQKGRCVSGILLLDKALGLTSNAALQQLKHFFKAAKAGHTGSLDPLATGLLPICFGEATKMSAFLLEADKGYRTTIQLGQQTTTGDSEGEVVKQRPVVPISDPELEVVLARFRGPISQIPPMFSALKRDGEPLYKLARQGVVVEREARQVVIHALVVIGRSETHIELDVRCSKGTYIRTLAEDIGEVLGCGAHVSALRRTLVGPFSLESAYTFDALTVMGEAAGGGLDGMLLALDSGLNGWPEVLLNNDMAYYLRQGQAVLVPKAPTSGLVKLYAEPRRFLGIGHILGDGRVAPKRLVN